MSKNGRIKDSTASPAPPRRDRRGPAMVVDLGGPESEVPDQRTPGRARRSGARSLALMFVVALALGGALGVLLFRPKTGPAPSQPPAANSPASRAPQAAPPPARLESLTVAPEPAPSTPPAALPAETGAPAAAAPVERQAPPEAAAKTTPPAEAAAAAAALRPSFDCRYAHTGAERIVCGDSALAAADRRLAQAYRNAVRSGVPESQLRQTQGDWLVQRENAAPDRAALDAMYDRRIQELENLAR